MTVNSIKGLVGHSGAGAGAVEAASVALAIDQPDPAGDARAPPARPRRSRSTSCREEPRPWEPGLALSCNVSLGGHNGCVAFRPA
ncbi:MAG: hypothetical protein R2726_06480 [Acidimicrobiales bacterium]